MRLGRVKVYPLVFAILVIDLTKGKRVNRVRFSYLQYLSIHFIEEHLPMGKDEQAIRNLVATWMEATNAGDVARIVPLMADDVLFSDARRTALRGPMLLWPASLLSHSSSGSIAQANWRRLS